MSTDGTKLFGVSLSKLMARPGEKNIPTFVKNVMRDLNRDGVVRVFYLSVVLSGCASLSTTCARWCCWWACAHSPIPLFLFFRIIENPGSLSSVGVGGEAGNTQETFG
jgi:hypothetical protein